MTPSVFQVAQTLAFSIAGTAVLFFAIDPFLSLPTIALRSKVFVVFLIAAALAILLGRAGSGTPTGVPRLSLPRSAVMRAFLQFSTNLLVSSLVALIFLFTLLSIVPSSSPFVSTTRAVFVLVIVGLLGSLLARQERQLSKAPRAWLALGSSAFLGWMLVLLLTLPVVNEIVVAVGAASLNGLFVWSLTAPREPVP